MYLMVKRKFPVLWTIILLVAIAALIDELGYLVIDIPWFPVIAIVVALGVIINRLFL